MKITKKDLDENNFYKEDGIDTEEPIEIDENLFYVKFKKSVKTTSYIFAKAGTGIITFFGNIIAKFISCLRICVGFNSIDEYTIEAEIRKGQVILGKVVKRVDKK